MKGETDNSGITVAPWQVWLSGLSVSLRTDPVRAHAWVASQVPSRGRTRGNHTLMSLSLSFSLPSLLSKSKIKKILKKKST